MVFAVGFFVHVDLLAHGEQDAHVFVQVQAGRLFCQPHSIHIHRAIAPCFGVGIADIAWDFDNPCCGIAAVHGTLSHLCRAAPLPLIHHFRGIRPQE